MKFKFLTGDINWQEYGGKFISKRLNNGDWDYWLVLEVINWNEYEREPECKYTVSLMAVSPQAAGEENIAKAFECCGTPDDEIRNNPLVQVEALSSYGVTAPLWSESGNNLNILLREAHKQASMQEMLFGFYMDAPKNRLGNTGWDFIAGDLGFK